VTLFNLYRFWFLRVLIAYYELALQQIEPTHEDVPHIVRTLVRLSDQLDSLKGTA
jgi:hypothetical protein